MRAETIRDYLRAAPFVPFRVFLSDGTWHDIPHPEWAWITRNRLFIATGVDREGLPDRNVMCDMLHVTKVESPPADGTAD